MVSIWNKVDIFQKINNTDKIYAHRTEAKKETLKEHSENALKVLDYINTKKDILAALNRALDEIEIFVGNKSYGNVHKEAKNIIIDMFYNAIYLHDIGKINPIFQKNQMSNNEIDFSKIDKLTAMETHHSFLSAAIYMDTFYSIIGNIKSPAQKFLAQFILISFSQIIYCHHENLYDLNKFVDSREFTNKIISKLENRNYDYFYKDKINQNIMEDIKKIDILESMKNSKISFTNFNFYILNKLLESLLISCDFISTYSFFNDLDITEVDFGLIENQKAVYDIYKESDIYKNIAKYKDFKDEKTATNPFEKEPINVLRSEMFLEALENLIKNNDKLIYNLEMPTGSGKTNTSINLSLNILEQGRYDKLFYIFPFNTLIDQTTNTFKSIFNDKLEFQAINSVIPVLSRRFDTGEIDYNKTLIDRQLLNYPVVLTSHVNLFNILFGIGREATMPLFQLLNSVIILDEIQSYKNLIWREIIEFFYKYSKILNIKIIIMSATLPNLQDLIGFDKEKFINLIDKTDKYYQNPLFKGRVNIKYDLLEYKNFNFGILKDKIIESIEERNKKWEKSKVLVEFIKKKSAKEFTSYLKENIDITKYKILELTGDDSLYEREKIINEIKTNNEENIILVTTQIIEAGVDIDMDIGFKDTSLLDNDEQFLGRINRSCKKEDCIAYFFDYDSEKSIYKEDLRLGKNLLTEEYQYYLENKNFKPYYEENFEKIRILKSRLNESDNISRFYSDVMFLYYEKIQNYMKLIYEETFQIFLPYIIEGYEEKTSDGNVSIIDLQGEKVWEEYTKLVENNEISYSEKRIRLMNIREKINLFTYQMYGKGLEDIKEYTGISYIPDGDRFIKDNKFDRKLFQENYTIIK